MRLLTRHLVQELGQIFLVTLTALTLIMLLTGVGKEAYERGLGAGPILHLVPYLMPSALLFAVPAAVLFSVTFVFGRMSAGGEVIALKALGISPSVVLLPVVWLACGLSLVTVWLNDVAMTWGYKGVQSVVIDSVEEIIYGILRKHRSYSSPGFSVNVKRVEGRTLVHPTFNFQSTGDSPAVTITAEEATLRSVPGSGVLTIVCRNGTVDVGDTSFAFSDTIEREIQLVDPRHNSDASLSPSHVPLHAIPERTERQITRIERLDEERAAWTAYRLALGEYGRLTGPEEQSSAGELRTARFELFRLRTEPYRRWANGFSCLCFALVGAPMAIRRRHSDIWASFFACFLPILLVYYPLMVYGVDRAKGGALPPQSVWLANLVLLAWAGWLTRRVFRY